MKLAYLLNSYPMTSTTFIRSEIEELEALGQPVKRFAVRHWEVPLVDPADLAEQQRTEYLLTGNTRALLSSATLEPFVNLIALLRTLPLLWHVFRQAGGGLVRHIGYLLQAIYLRRRTQALGIDHIHAHFSTNAATVAMLSQALGGPTFSFTVHGPDELVEPKRNAMKAKVEHSAFVAAITDYCRGRILQEAPACADKIQVVRCGIKLAKFAPDGEPGAAHHYVCVGRLCVNKAQAIIPEAVAAVRDEFPDVMVHLLGDGDERAHVEAEIARWGVQDNVRILGWATADVVREEIARSSCLLLPSLAEGLPIVLMESLALERPVLTTIIAGIPELVDDGCGWIFPSGSTEALTEALRASLRSSPAALEAMGEEGRRRVERLHDSRKSAETLLAHFRRATAA